MEFIYSYTNHKDINYLKYTYDNLLVRWDALSGILPGALLIILGITSNKVSLKLLGGKFWKQLQSLVYPTFLLSIIHVSFTSRFDNFYIFLAGFVIIIRLMAYSIDKNKQKSGITTKYKCIPCGYIYDETAGDPDSGIAPGTKFEDIPYDWTCPICGVSKADFEPFYEGENTIFGGYLGEVIGYNMLTEDVLELEISLNNKINIIPGQYASLILNDFDGDFTRSYSIVEQNGNTLKFAIKLKIDGRGGRKLKLMKIGDKVKVKGIYGAFTLKNTSNPKVFIAIGTGLAPIINILSKLSSPYFKGVQGDYTNNKLFFGVRAKTDVFYEEVLKSFSNLEVNIFLSKEEIEGYNFGRIDLSKYNFDENTEFYICGNPALVNDTFKFLNEKGYKNIYREKFS